MDYKVNQKKKIDALLSSYLIVLVSKIRRNFMARRCEITGNITGNNVSHANNKTRRRFSS